MDTNEASAMTEASGLANEREHTADARPRTAQPPSQDAVVVWADRLRKVTLKAPLQSLAVAFVLGMWIARRR
jgi:hypothetical protein